MARGEAEGHNSSDFHEWVTFLHSRGQIIIGKVFFLHNMANFFVRVSKKFKFGAKTMNAALSLAARGLTMG